MVKAKILQVKSVVTVSKNSPSIDPSSTITDLKGYSLHTTTTLSVQGTTLKCSRGTP